MIELTLVMKGTPEAYRTLEELREEGYNATVLTTESLHHALEYNPGDHNFITLRHLEQQGNLESVLCVFLLKEEEVEQVSAILREEMTSAADLSVALEVDMHTGKNWYEAK